MTISKQSQKIAISFVIVLGLSLAMILFDLSRMNLMQSKLDAIIKEHTVKSELMSALRNGLYERQIRLRNIILMKDPFERDDEAAKFNLYENKVVSARNKFLSMKLSKEEKQLFEKINAAMIVAHRAQLTLIEDSIYHDDKEINHKVIGDAFSPQKVVVDMVAQMIALQKTATQRAVFDAEKSYSEAKTSVYLLGGSALTIGIIVALIVLRLTESQVRSVNEAMSEIEESRHLLEERVAQRTKELALARDDALASNKAKDIFLANMSHELRTPLNIILGYSELLEEDAVDEGNHKIAADLKKIQHAAQLQLQLVDSILDIARIEEGQLIINSIDFDVEKLLYEIEQAAKPLMFKNNNTFTINCMHGIGMMYSDNMRIRQILLNLISNAAKFTQHGMISLNVTKDVNSDVIEFKVQDTGIGMSECYLKEVFKKFTQADSSTTRKYGGSGLGLAISKQLSNQLNGDITVTSEEGKGTFFLLTIPIVYSEN